MAEETKCLHCGLLQAIIDHTEAQSLTAVDVNEAIDALTRVAAQLIATGKTPQAQMSMAKMFLKRFGVHILAHGVDVIIKSGSIKIEEPTHH